MIQGNTFTTVILDDNYEQFLIEVNYDIQPMMMVPDKIFNIEYKIDSAAKMSKADLDSTVRDLIKSEEATTIEFI